MSHSCILCYKSIKNRDFIQIFDKNGITLNIANIIKKHFWFKIVENDDGVINVVCIECWIQLYNFNKYYNIVESVHNSDNTSFRNTKNPSKKFKTNNKHLASALNSIAINQERSDVTPQEDVIGLNWMLPVNNEFENITEIGVQKCSDVILNDSCQVIESNNIDINDNDFAEKNYSEEIFSLNIQLCDDVEDNKNIVNNNNNTVSVKQRTLGSKGRMRKGITPKILNNTNNDIDDKNLQIYREDAQIREYFKMKCDLCTVKFRTFEEAKLHYCQMHGCKGYISCCNQKKHYYRAHILDHISAHLNPYANKCALCNKIYANKIALKNHLDSHASPDHKPFKCELCPKSFTKRFHLNHHKKHRHCKEEDKKFTCDICVKSFLSKSILTSHIKGVHLNAYSQICDVCAKVFKSKKILEYHRELHFREPSETKLQCSICGAWLKHENSLRAHLARHNDVTHNCQKCGKEASSKGALKNHLRYVHAERKYDCKLCTKAFKKPIGLKEHMASHTGETLYTCPYCPKKFNSGANMHSHRKKMHPIEWQQNRGNRRSQTH